MSLPGERQSSWRQLRTVPRDELFKLIKTIVRRSIRSRTGTTMLEGKIRSLLEEIRHDHERNLSVTDETMASIAVCRIVASLLRQTGYSSTHSH